MNCNYKVKIKDIQNKYQFKIFCKTYDDTKIQGDIETLNSEVEALQEENLYLNNLVEQAFDKKEVEGEELSIDDTINAKMEVGLLGNTKQETTTGKNKWSSELQQGARVFSNGTLNTSLTTYVVNKDPIPVIAGQTYTISATGYNFVHGGGFVFFNDGTFVSGASTNSTKVTIPSGCNQLYYNFYNPDNISVNDISNIQLEPGSTASSYEKYTGGIASPNPSYPSNVNVVTGDNTIVVSNKNKFNFEDLLSKIQTFTISGNASEFTINGVGTYQYPISITTEEIVSGRWSSTNLNGDVKVIYEDDTNANIFSSYSSSSVSGNINFVPTKKVKAIQFRTYNNNNIKFNNFQIEKGSTATPYEEHQEQTFQINLGNIELCGIGDYQDYFYKSNNKWYLHKEIGKVVLDGNITGSIKSDIQNENTICFRTDAGVTNILSNSKPISNYFTAINDTSDVEHIRYIGTSGYRFQLFLSKQKATTANEVITWLSTHNTIVYYVLATPTNTEITDTTLISQLEALKSAMSYAGQTNISQINDDVPFILKVTALASYNSRILALENAILNANRNVAVENSLRKASSNEIIEEPKEEVTEKEEVEEPKEEVVDDNKDKNIIKEEK